MASCAAGDSSWQRLPAGSSAGCCCCCCGVGRAWRLFGTAGALRQPLGSSPAQLEQQGWGLRAVSLVQNQEAADAAAAKAGAVLIVVAVLVLGAGSSSSSWAAGSAAAGGAAAVGSCLVLLAASGSGEAAPGELRAVVSFGRVPGAGAARPPLLPGREGAAKLLQPLSRRLGTALLAPLLPLSLLGRGSGWLPGLLLGALLADRRKEQAGARGPDWDTPAAGRNKFSMSTPGLL